MQHTSVVRLKKIENLQVLKKTFRKPSVFIFFTSVGNKKPKSSTLPKPFTHLKLIKRSSIFVVFKNHPTIKYLLGKNLLYLSIMYTFPSKASTLALLSTTGGLVFQNAVANCTFYDSRRLYLMSLGSVKRSTPSLIYLFCRSNPYLTVNYIATCTSLLHTLRNSFNSI